MAAAIYFASVRRDVDDRFRICCAVILLASFHDPAVVFEQLSLIYTLPRYLVRSFRLILPFFPTGTMERIDTEGQVSGGCAVLACV